MNFIHRGCAVILRKGDAVTGVRAFSVCTRSLQEEKSTALQIFDQEYNHQLHSVLRIEKVSVEYENLLGEKTQLQMNKNISTPYSCAKHINEEVTTQSAIALVNNQIHEMHKPLTEDCSLKLLTVQDQDPTDVNQAFWRTCSFMLGSILQRAFKPESNVTLHRSLPHTVESGSFGYEFSADFGEWEPSQRELGSLSVMGSRLSHGYKTKNTHPHAHRVNSYYIQPLDVSIQLAKQMFSNNSYKLAELDELSSEGDKVTVYKMGTHVDLLSGPLVSNANHVGRYNVTAIHKIGECSNGNVYQAQGVALPYSITMHSFTYKMLQENAARLNNSAREEHQTHTESDINTRQQREEENAESMRLSNIA